MKQTFFAGLLALAALAAPARADSLPVAEGFARAVKFTVRGYRGSEPLEDFPVLVRLSESAVPGFDYDDMMFPEASYDDAERDLCFIEPDGTPLAYDVDTWRDDGDSLLWVTLPVLTNGTEFVMCWRSARSGKAVCADNAFQGYVGVWHMGDPGDADVVVADSGPNGLTARASEESIGKADGMIGGTRQIINRRAKVDKAVKVVATPEALSALDTLGENFHASFWMRPVGTIDGNADTGIMYDAVIGRMATAKTDAWALQFAKDGFNAAPAGTYGNFRIFAANPTHSDKGDNVAVLTPAKGTPFTRGVWSKLDLVYRGQNYDFYQNGALVVSGQLKNGLAAVQGSETLAIGGFAGQGERPFFGDMDEVRVGAFVPTADWVRADHDQATNATFLASGAVAVFADDPHPIFSHRLADLGATFAQMEGILASCGGEATSCDIQVKVWRKGEPEPAEWTTIASGIGPRESFVAFTTELEPETEYLYKNRAVNNESPAWSSTVDEGSFTTHGAGKRGAGGAPARRDDDFVHRFVVAADGTATYEFTPPDYVTSVEALVVGGGGAGGFGGDKGGGAGGGAGGFIYDDALPLTGGTAYTVTVGAGGAASEGSTVYGGDGGASTIAPSGGSAIVTAYGGGAGGNGVVTGNSNVNYQGGRSGGSGGGAAANKRSAGTGRTGQGNSGGTTPSDSHAAGGGGAGGVGVTVSTGAATTSAGAGGVGLDCDITGVSLRYAGGGGGGGLGNNDEYYNYGSPGDGGSGGGGRGGQKRSNGETDGDGVAYENARDGVDGFGGGGGGGSTVEGSRKGGNGGSGVVIVRYPAQGDGSDLPDPWITLIEASYDASAEQATVSFRLDWAGLGYRTADASVVWGYSPNTLTHEAPLASGIIGRRTISFPLENRGRTVYLRLSSSNAGGRSALSEEIVALSLGDAAPPRPAFLMF